MNPIKFWFCILAVLCGRSGVGSQAANATLELNGVIPISTSASSTTASATITSANFTTGLTDQSVATINEKCNKQAGYTVTLSSAGAAGTTQAKLVGSAGAAGESINYTMKYDGVTITLAGGSALVTDANDKTPNTGINKTLAITFSAGFYAAGVYSDTLTFTITEK